MIKIVMMPHGVEITGHAGAAPVGHDIVCAAVSGLAYTLREALNDKGLLSTSVMEPGHGLLTSTDRHHPYLDMAEIGFRMLAEHNPEYVNFFSCRVGRDNS